MRRSGPVSGGPTGSSPDAAAAEERERHLAAAQAALERAAAVWSDAKLPAALEPHRTRALAAIDAELAGVRGRARE